MPELPDVEVFKRYLDATSLHKKIKGVHVGNKKILGSVSAGKLKSKLKGESFISTDRHGKYLFTGLKGGEWLVFHFGMTGFLQYYRDEQQEPGHTRLRVSFSNGYHLAYDAQRMLGEVDLAGTPGDFIEEKKLGPDALALDPEAFQEALSHGRGGVKSSLMNQGKIAGIGNVYSDEILFQAGIHPGASVKGLSRKETRGLFRAMGRVLKKAIDKKADPEKLPGTYLIPHRGPEEKCPKCGGKVRKKKISGRTSYFCPKCQKK